MKQRMVRAIRQPAGRPERLEAGRKLTDFH
jgi:hypothetical protein